MEKEKNVNIGEEAKACELSNEELSRVAGGESALDIVDRVIRGDYGNGREREDRLRAAGYDYGMVEQRVKERLGYNERRSGVFDDE